MELSYATASLALKWRSEFRASDGDGGVGEDARAEAGADPPNGGVGTFKRRKISVAASPSTAASVPSSSKTAKTKKKTRKKIAPWTAAEEALLIRLQREHGNR